MREWITTDGIYLRPVAKEKNVANQKTSAQEKIAAKRNETAKKQEGGEAQKAGRVNNIQIEGIIQDCGYQATSTGKDTWKGRLEVSQGTDKDGTWKPKMVFFITLWHNEGENDDQFAESLDINDKDRVVVEGKIGMNQYNDKEGNQKTAWKITASRVSVVS
jgi:hypothetical protein